MLETTSSPKKGETTWLWLAKIITGLLIIVLLIIHFIVNHFIGQHGLLTYADVVAYYQIPIIPIMEIAFLAFVVSHSLIGLRSIILDMRPSAGVLTAVNWLFLVVGVGSVIYGVWLIRAIVASGSS
jgi:succinate dehydrogenase / fumarate reductase membrane anchor subunit